MGKVFQPIEREGKEVSPIESEEESGAKEDRDILLF